MSKLITEMLELDKKYQSYSNNPESHPKYQEEWKLFWKILYIKGIYFKDTAEYVPFWVPYWLARMKNLQENEELKLVNNLHEY